MLTCEVCGHEMEGLYCDKCEKDLPGDALFCCYCGKSLAEGSEDPVQTVDDNEAGDPCDLENRVLCSDENCIGIIENGVCTECGQPYKPSE